MAGKLLVSLRDRVLLVNSQITEDHPWLLELLSRQNRISEEMAASLPAEQRNFLQNMIWHLVKAAESEWKPHKAKFVEDKGEDRSKWLNCSLCRQPNRIICYIVNERNGNMLNVGRECVNAFSLSDAERELLKDQSRIRQLTKLNEEFPGIHDTVQSWNRVLDKYPILIPNSVSQDYVIAGERLREFYEGFLGETYDDSVFQEIKLILQKKKAQLAAIDQWVLKNKHNKYIPDRKLIAWLKNNGGHAVIEMLREDGEITWRTVHRIKNPKFLQSLIGDLNDILEDHGITVNSVDPNYRGSVGYVFTLNNIQLFCNHADFLLRFGGLLFGEELHNDPREAIRRSVPYTEASVYHMLDAIGIQLKPTPLSMYRQDFEFNEILFADKNSDKYISVELNDFVKRFKGIALGLPDENIEDVIRYIYNKRNKRYNKKELRERDQVRSQFNK